MGPHAYLDSSAIVKLARPEDETPALVEAVAAWPQSVSSELSMVEVPRALAPSPADAVDPLLSRLALRPIDREILPCAARLPAPTLRSLDAIHLATALALDPPIEAFVSYDRRLNDAARAAGLRVESPGAP